MAPKTSSKPQPAPYLGQKGPGGKVWAGDGWGWQSPATYTRLAGQGQLNTQRNPLQWVDNNLRWLGATTNSLNKGTKFVGLAGAIPIYQDSKGQFSTSTPAQRQVVHASTAQPLTNAALAVTNLGQRLLSGQPLKPQKPENTRVGQAILGLNREAAIGMGAKPVEQLDQSQRDLLSALPSSIATNAALGFVAPLRVGSAAFAGLATKVPFLSAGAQQVLARGLAWGATAGINEAASGILDDSTQGQAGDLLKAVGVPVPQAFLTTPEDDRISAGLKGIVPGIAFGEALGLPLGVGSKVAELAPNALRNLREQRVGADVIRARQEAVATGLQVPDGSGGYEFQADRTAAAAPAAPAAPAAGGVVDQPAAPPVEAAPAPSAAEAVAGDQGLVEAPAVPAEAMPDVAPAAPVAPELEPDAPVSYDPSLPELDVPAMALQRLDDQGLQAVAQGQGPVLDRLEGVLSQQQLPMPNPARSTEVAAAPTEALAEPSTPWREQWEALPNDQLLGLAHPAASPDLYERVQAMTGRDWGQLTRTDVLDGLSALQQEGTTVLPQRLGDGQVLADVGSLTVDPARMQFRSGVDPESGVVPGQEIQGGWDPTQEGTIKVWQDPSTGEQVLVDGHRRVEAARRLGIRTLPAEESLVPTADAARMEGAVTNIAGGTASPADAGAALRQMGVTDPAGLEAIGIPVEQGAPGMALARLPQGVNNWVEQGVLPEARAMAIGASGLDEKGMRSAARFSRTQAGQSLSDAEFAEVMALSGSRLGDDPLAKVGSIQQELDSTGSYYEGPLKLERETYDNGNFRTTVEVGTSALPADWLARRGIADPASVSKIRQTTLLRDYTLERLRELPPGDYALDALDEARARIYRRWFDGGKIAGIAEAESPALRGTSWTYRPQDDPKALINQPARAGKAPTAATFTELAGRARLVAAVKEQLPPELHPVLDQMKTQQGGPVALLLDQGAAEIGSGAIPEVVANRIKLQVEQGAAAAPAPAAGAAATAPTEAAAPGPMTAADRAALRQQLLAEAVANGEVRPSAQPLIPAPDAPAVDVPRAVADLEEQLRTTGTVAPDTPAARLLEEEARLEAEYSARDAVIQAEVQRARREAADFWKLSFDERVANGLIGEGWTTPTARQQVLESSGAPKGWDSVEPTEKPYFIELGGNASAAIKVENELLGIVQQVAGPDAVVRLQDRYRYSVKPAEWGGDGQKVGMTRGTYELMRDVVTINGILDGTKSQLLGTAYHEAFHRVQYGLLTPQEMKVLDSAFGLERINNYSQLSPQKVALLERQAVAFQNYATARRAGSDAMRENMLAQLESQLNTSGTTLGEGAKKMIVQVAQAFEKLADFIDRVKNFAQGNGFQTVDDIFERVYSGQIAKQRAFDSALELLTPNQVERAKTLQRWRKDNRAPVQDIAQRVSDLDAQIESLKAKATAGGC